MKFNLINANIITLDNNNPNIKSLTIENGKITSINDIQNFSANTPVFSRIKNLMKNTFFNNSSEDKSVSNDTVDSNKTFSSPLPGMIISVSVNVGDEIVIGDEICVLEAMKMQQSLKATWSGIVSSVGISPGDKVTTGQTLVIIN